MWGLRPLGISGATRVCGPDLAPHLLCAAEEEGIPVGFYGGSRQVLKRPIEVVSEPFPRLPVACAFSPPFRALGLEEDLRIPDEINRSAARILFVGLNNPKQDRWIWERRGRVRAGDVPDICRAECRLARPVHCGAASKWDALQLWR
ncbi:MAG: WecB/TagA/CpsF family glycosyltransferase [Acidobacteria bacterium]|nr:WecB/TagA/CpsF family glycosyltransferase [Acidobacteriota bacterium]